MRERVKWAMKKVRRGGGPGVFRALKEAMFARVVLYALFDLRGRALPEALVEGGVVDVLDLFVG